MSNIFNPDFIEFIRALNKSGVRYLLVGGYSVILHGYSRTTGDLDVWIDKTPDNYERLKTAFQIFSMPLFDMSKDRFLSSEFDVFSYGRPPVSIDIMTQVKGLSFAEAYGAAETFEINQTKIRVLHLNHLRKAKRASNRPKDQDDLLNLSDEDQ